MALIVTKIDMETKTVIISLAREGELVSDIEENPIRYVWDDSLGVFIEVMPPKWLKVSAADV